MPDNPKLTAARRQALAVLLFCERYGQQVRISDVTDKERSLVNHTVAAWFHTNGYATRSEGRFGLILSLTATGRALAQETERG